MLNFLKKYGEFRRGAFEGSALVHYDHPHTEEQGRYPVSFISLKKMKQQTYAEATKQFKGMCVACLMKLEYLLKFEKNGTRRKELMSVNKEI